MFVISAIAACLGSGVKFLKKGGTFYAAKATRGNWSSFSFFLCFPKLFVVFLFFSFRLRIDYNVA